ncbi:hypothetical protein QR680_017642 [Steinernema hermaphroditum]|uniref:Glutathione S-transferase n=1 Tax=Steinernema hermaphroditum TaxID=289476 RepID=A0AA39LPN6_9BILA|nr:hypothetical protein QR680_017642 [Steinernema hermaphroditum]
MVYELVYIDIRGLAEMMRLLLADQGIAFTEERIGDLEKWKQMKAGFAFGQVPCLKEGDKALVQTGAIMRHLARKHNLYGKTEEEQTYADMFFECIRDIHVKYVTLIYYEYDVEGKKEKYIGEDLPQFLGQLEKLFVSHQNGEKFVLGETLSFVDYALFEELDIHLILDPHALDKFPALKAFHGRFGARPSLKEYLEKRKAANVKVNGNGKQ